MELRNKKTGEIIALESPILFDSEECTYEFPSIEALNEEWEDCEELKEYWFIDCDGSVYQNCQNSTRSHTNHHKIIGNYFKTRKEAEKAVEKLEAWKRLKDNGFSFEGTNNSKRKTAYFINYDLGKSFNSQNESEQAMKDLDLLFGGEDEQLNS